MSHSPPATATNTMAASGTKVSPPGVVHLTPDRNPSGKPPVLSPWVSTKATPRKMAMVPRVMMNG